MYSIGLVYFLLILITSVCAGMLEAMAGLGGGILIVPFLTALLNVNVDYAIGASIIAVIATSSGSAYAYVKEKVSNVRIGTFLVLFTVPGAIIGAVIEGFTQPKYLFLVFGLIMFFSLFAMYKKLKEKEDSDPVVVDDKLADRLKLHSKYYDPKLKKEIKYKVQHVKEGSLVMFFAGIASGLLGIGAGAFNVLGLDMIMKLPIKVSTTTSNFMIGITAAASAGIYGKKERTKLIKDLLPKNVTYKNEKIIKVDLANRTVYSKNAHYQYDKLIMASGSKPSPEKITGLDTLSQKYGDIFTNEQQSLKFWQNLNRFKVGKLVVGVSYPIYKFPPVALEALFLIEENLRKRRIRDKTQIFFFAPFTGAYRAKPMDEVIQPILHKKGIELLAPFDIDTVDMEKRVLNSLEGESLNFDLALIVPPFTGTDAMPENLVTEDGYIATDKQKLNIKGFDDAFAIGDVASIPSAKSGATTHLEAKVLAKRLSGIDAKYDGRTNCPFEVGDGKATFVIGNYTTETAKIVPKRSYYYMKKFSGRIYWSTIKGKYEWLYDWYFNYMNPKKMLERYG